jgi:hypothetical protein
VIKLIELTLYDGRLLYVPVPFAFWALHKDSSRYVDTATQSRVDWHAHSWEVREKPDEIIELMLKDEQ